MCAQKEKETAQEAGQLTEAGNKGYSKTSAGNLTTKHETKAVQIWFGMLRVLSQHREEAKDAIKIFFAEENGIIDDLSLALEKNDFDTSKAHTQAED